MAKRPTEPPAMLDAPAIAELCGCSVMHIRRMAARGEMPSPVRLGQLVRWPRQTIMRWLQADTALSDDRDFVRNQMPAERSSKTT